MGRLRARMTMVFASHVRTEIRFLFLIKFGLGSPTTCRSRAISGYQGPHGAVPIQYNADRTRTVLSRPICVVGIYRVGSKAILAQQAREGPSYISNRAAMDRRSRHRRVTNRSQSGQVWRKHRTTISPDRISHWEVDCAPEACWNPVGSLRRAVDQRRSGSQRTHDERRHHASRGRSFAC